MHLDKLRRINEEVLTRLEGGGGEGDAANPGLGVGERARSGGVFHKYVYFFTTLEKK